jgi:hypothetical protein
MRNARQVRAGAIMRRRFGNHHYHEEYEHYRRKRGRVNVAKELY